MSNHSGQGRFLGWEYLEEYAPAVNLVQEMYPGIGTTVLETQRAFKEATEVPTTAVLREYPPEEKQLAYFIEKYVLNRPRTGATYDATTQIRRPSRQAETQTNPALSPNVDQTDTAPALETTPRTTKKAKPHPLVPSHSVETQTPSFKHPLSSHDHSRPQPPLCDTAPVLRENFVRSLRPKDSDFTVPIT